MATQRQIEANRRNARRSTGPKSLEGKRRSSQNALRHGLLAAAPVIPGESRAEYEAHLDSFLLAYAPRDAVEAALVRQMASAEWRLRRLERMEAGLYWYRYNNARAYEQAPYHPEKRVQPENEAERDELFYGEVLNHMAANTALLANYARYEAMVRRAFYQALQSLEALKKLRAGQTREAAPALEEQNYETKPNPPQLPPMEQVAAVVGDRYGAPPPTRKADFGQRTIRPEPVRVKMGSSRGDKEPS